MAKDNMMIMVIRRAASLLTLVTLEVQACKSTHLFSFTYVHNLCLITP